MNILNTRSEVSHNNLKMVQDTQPSQDASRHQICDSYLIGDMHQTEAGWTEQLRDEQCDFYMPPKTPLEA